MHNMNTDSYAPKSGIYLAYLHESGLTHARRDIHRQQDWSGQNINPRPDVDPGSTYLGAAWS